MVIYSKEQSWSGCWKDEEARDIGLQNRDDLIRRDCGDMGKVYSGEYNDCGGWKFQGKCIDIDVSKMNWGNWDDKGCVGGGSTKKEARLWNIPGRVDWSQACNKKINTPEGLPAGNIKNRYCENRGINGEYGIIEVEDAKCSPERTSGNWGDWKDGGCSKPGIKKWYSRLFNIPNGKSWEEACDFMINSHGLQGEVVDKKCVNRGIEGEFGEVFIKDPICLGSWGTFDSECLEIGKKRYFSQLQVPQNLDWEETCNASGETILPNGQKMKPTRCVNRTKLGIGGGIWGEFEVDDPSCVKKTSAIADKIGQATDIITKPITNITESIFGNGNNTIIIFIVIGIVLLFLIF